LRKALFDESDMNQKIDPILLSVTETAKLLGVSVPTLRTMRSTTSLKNLEIPIGKRIKFSKEDILEYLKGVKDEGVPWVIPEGQLSIVSTNKKINLEVQEGLFDLRGIKHIDPYGTLSLLTHLIDRSKEGKKTRILPGSTIACKKLKFVGFFDYLEEFAPSVEWDRKILKGEKYFPPESLLPITLLQRKGEERRSVERLNSLFIQEGFSEEIGGYTGWLLGELADNSLTHGGKVIDERTCFIQAQRYTIGENSKCVIIGLADIGQGIQNSLRINPKYNDMSDFQAVLNAFRLNISSWSDEYKRGKGLTDIIKIAMGNKSLLRVSSGSIDFELDFQVEKDPGIIKVSPPLFDSKGTRFGFLYIDHEFNKITRAEADEFIRKELEKYEHS
jgi:excisionase family DNA binding protein